MTAADAARPLLDERFGALGDITAELGRPTPPLPRRGRRVDGPASTSARCRVLTGRDDPDSLSAA